MRALLLLCLVVPLASSTSAQTVAERLASGMCSVDPNLSIDADGLLRVGNPAEPDSVSVCFVSYERSPGGVVTLRTRVFLPYANLLPAVEAMMTGLAEEMGDTTTDPAELAALAGPVTRMLAHAVALEYEQSVRCSTGESLRMSGGIYDLTGARLMDVPLGLDRGDQMMGMFRRICEVEG